MGNQQASETPLTNTLPTVQKKRIVRKQLAIRSTSGFVSINNETALLQWVSPTADDILTQIRVSIVPTTLIDVSTDDDAALPTALLISSFEFPALKEEEITLRTEVWDARGISDTATKKGLERLLVALLRVPDLKSMFFFNPKITDVDSKTMTWKPADVDVANFNVLFSENTEPYKLPSGIPANLFTPSAFHAGLAAVAGVGAAFTFGGVGKQKLNKRVESLKAENFNNLSKLQEFRNEIISWQTEGNDVTKLMNIVIPMMEIVNLEVDELEFSD